MTRCSQGNSVYVVFHMFVFSGYTLETDRNSVSVSVMVSKVAIFLVSVTAIIMKCGFGLLSVIAETTARFWHEPKLSLWATR